MQETELSKQRKTHYSQKVNQPHQQTTYPNSSDRKDKLFGLKDDLGMLKMNINSQCLQLFIFISR